MWLHLVVVSTPTLDVDLGLAERVEDLTIEQLWPQKRFSEAIRRISALSSGEIEWRPPLRRGLERQRQ